MVDLISPFYRWANCSSEKQHTWSGLVQRRDRFWLFVLFGQAACGILVPQLGIQPWPLKWKWGVLTTGLPRKALVYCFKPCFHSNMFVIFLYQHTYAFSHYYILIIIYFNIKFSIVYFGCVWVFDIIRHSTVMNIFEKMSIESIHRVNSIQRDCWGKLLAF